MLDRAEPPAVGNAFEANRKVSAAEGEASAAAAQSAVPQPVNAKGIAKSANASNGFFPAVDSPWLNRFLWAFIAIYLVVFSAWAWRAGMQLRDDAWTYTRTIRFHGDIANGIHWGSEVLNAAENAANAKSTPAHPGSKALIARAAPDPANPNERPLTFWELIHAEDAYYQRLVNEQPTDGDYRLDYPPLRLLAMTLWTQHVAHQIHTIPSWPGAYRELHYSATGDPAQLIDENIAQPMLLANSYVVAATAICTFFLVWIWVNRGGRPNSLIPRPLWQACFLPRQQLVPWKPTPLSRINGLAVFLISATAFFYVAVIAESPAPPPSPAIAFVGRPVLARTPDGKGILTVYAHVDGQGSDPQWFVEWGTNLLYGHQTNADSAGDDDVSVKIRDLPAATTIHYRLVARNDQGITRSDDQVFNTADASIPAAPHRVYGAIWLSLSQWIGVAILFCLMAGSLKYLPPVHRGWAAGLAAALFVWFDPAVIVDTHVWPQWDAWVLLPFFLGALLATLDWWFLAGVVLGVGVMFKGQTLMVGPLLAFWPLFSGRWGPLLRLTAGFVLAAGLVLFPWLVLDNGAADWSVGALRWISCVMAAAAIAGALSLYRKAVRIRALAVHQELKDEWYGRLPSTDPSAYPAAPPQTSLLNLTLFCASLLAGIVMVTLLLLKRWPSDGDLPRIMGLFLLLAVLIPPWFLPRRTVGVWIAAIFASSIWMSAFLYHGDWSWKTVGFEYGARKFPVMALGTQRLGNIPQILASRFQWGIDDTALIIHPPDLSGLFHLATRAADGSIVGWVHNWGLDGSAITLDIRQFMMALFVLFMVTAGIAAGIQSRRNDPRILAAFAALWTLMPTILCQMAQRYEMWIAAATSVLIAISPGLGFAHIILSLLAAGIIGAQLLNADPSRSPLLHDILNRLGPDEGWIIAGIGLIILYTALAPRRRPTLDELKLS